MSGHSKKFARETGNPLSRVQNLAESVERETAAPSVLRRRQVGWCPAGSTLARR